MANIKSQIKRNLQNEKAEKRNKAVRSSVRNAVKRAEAAAGTDQADDALKVAIKQIDVAAQKGVIHKNAAARRKSRLVRNVAAASA